MKYSKYLEKLTKRIKEKAGYLSVDLLFAEILLDETIAENEQENRERAVITEKAEERFGSASDFRDRVAAMRDASKKSLSDAIMFQKLLFDAENLAKKENRSEITADLVFLAMLDNPTEQMMDSVKAPESPRFTVPKQKKESPAVLSESEERAEKSEEKEGTTPAVMTETTAEQQEADAEASRESNYSMLLQETGNAKTLQKKLMECVFGQNHAINVFTTGYFTAAVKKLIFKNDSRPASTFLFAGPPGVGKTYLAEKAAEMLGIPYMRFDMSEYSTSVAGLDLCGYDKNYSQPKKGRLTDFVSSHPECLILFDEIEKAGRDTIHLFLQMLDAGTLTDNYTKKSVSFSSAVIIMTTNVGKTLYDTSETGDFSTFPRKVILNALRKDVHPLTGVPLFPEAICSRFSMGNVVMFNHMEPQNLIRIAQTRIEDRIEQITSKLDIKIEVDPVVYSALLFAEGSRADARSIYGRAERFLNTEIFELFRLLTTESASYDFKRMKNIRIAVDLSGASADVSSTFVVDTETKILVLSDSEERLKESECCHYSYAADIAAASEMLRQNDYEFVIVNMHTEAKNGNKYMNFEDISSSSRDFLHFLTENSFGLPVFLLLPSPDALSEEEKYSYTVNGVRGFLTKDADDFEERIREIVTVNYRRRKIDELARFNHVLSYETAQSYDDETLTATITLFDFKIRQAVDSEDSSTILNDVSKPHVRFSDVIGAEEVKKELLFFVDFLKNSRRYIGTGIHAPKGILLYGPPGTGKTMVAKAMATEANATFIAVEGNRFLKKYVGEGPEKLHEMFRVARKYAPTVVFIDEIETIAKPRGNEFNHAGDQILTALLTEMDGFNTDVARPVLVMAATNYGVDESSGNTLDGAVLRRFDRKVYLGLPNRENRIKFLKMRNKSSKALCLSEEEINNIASRSVDMSLAELENVINFALRSAVRSGKTIVDDSIFEEAFETYNSGEEKRWSDDQLLHTARHEAGHALLCRLGGEKPSYLTVVSRGNHGGYMQHADNEDKMVYTKNELLARVRTALGGRASEIVYYGEEDGITTGASGDLAHATALVRNMLCVYGMDEDFGLVSVTDKTDSPEVKEAVKTILAREMEAAIRLIREYKDKVDELAEALIQKNSLREEEIEAILEDIDTSDN